MRHDLKTWPLYFDLMRSGKKTFEVRRDDRPYAAGDLLALHEWDPVTERYTGRRLFVSVTLVLRGAAIPEGYCAMQIRLGVEALSALRDIHARAKEWNNVPACSDIEHLAAVALRMEGGER